MANRREFRCNKSADNFCYICGLYTPIRGRRPIDEEIKRLYLQYFKIEISNQDKFWVLYSY